MSQDGRQVILDAIAAQQGYAARGSVRGHLMPHALGQGQGAGADVDHPQPLRLGSYRRPHPMGRAREELARLVLAQRTVLHGPEHRLPRGQLDLMETQLVPKVR